MDLDIGQAVQGGCGLVALYLAMQIRGVLKNHEIRITTLETKRASTGNRKRSGRPRH